MEKLGAAIEELEAQSGLDVRELSSLIDRLQGLLCRELHEATRRGDHLLEGRTPCGRVAQSRARLVVTAAAPAASRNDAKSASSQP